MLVTERMRYRSIHKPHRKIDVPFPITPNAMLERFGIDRMYAWALEEAKREIRDIIYRSCKMTDGELLQAINEHLAKNPSK